MTIIDIYKKYKIMPQLQLHQLRVAAVAQQICDNLTLKVDKEAVIKACLLHDMANIIKFDLTQFPQYSQPKGIDYWESVRQDFIQKYGVDEHMASVKIAKGLSMNEKILDYIESVDFGMAVQNAQRPELEPKICDYADLRVDPGGIVSVDQRLAEGAKRYKQRPDKWIKEEERDKLVAACRQEESQIFAHCKIKPSDITNKSSAPIIKRLKSYEI
jgi:HD superfamily phosphodiesterase